MCRRCLSQSGYCSFFPLEGILYSFHFILTILCVTMSILFSFIEVNRSLFTVHNVRAKKQAYKFFFSSFLLVFLFLSLLSSDLVYFLIFSDLFCPMTFFFFSFFSVSLFIRRARSFSRLAKPTAVSHDYSTGGFLIFFFFSLFFSFSFRKAAG